MDEEQERLVEQLAAEFSAKVRREGRAAEAVAAEFEKAHPGIYKLVGRLNEVAHRDLSDSIDIRLTNFRDVEGLSRCQVEINPSFERRARIAAAVDFTWSTVKALVGAPENAVEGDLNVMRAIAESVADRLVKSS